MTTATASASALINGTELYDAIMAEIEPELVSDELLLLEERYANESLQQKHERLQRYQEAFDLYEACFTAYMHEINQYADSCDRTMHKLQEEAEQMTEEAATAAFSALDDSSDS